MLILDIVLRILFSVLTIGFGTVMIMSGFGVLTLRDEDDSWAEKIGTWTLCLMAFTMSVLCLAIVVGIWMV